MLLQHNWCFLSIPRHWLAWFIIYNQRSLSPIITVAPAASLLLPDHFLSLTSMVHPILSSHIIIHYSRCCYSITAASWAFFIIHHHDSYFPIIALYHPLLRRFCSITAASSAFLIIDEHDSSFPIIARYKSISAAETSLLFPEHSSSLTTMIYYFSSSLVIINYGRCCCSITAAS